MATISSPPDAELLEQTILGSRAAYRVLSRGPDFVDVEVVEAPGMAPGLRFRMSAEAARAMDPPAVQRRLPWRRRRQAARVQPSTG